MTADPLVETSRNCSSYNYCFNTPIKLVDLDGRIPWNRLIEGHVYGPRLEENRFGARRSYIDNAGREVIYPHYGVDFGNDLCYGPQLHGGEKILSAARGTVIFARPTKLGGNTIVIDHGNGYSSVYCHIKDGGILVKENTQVKNGQIIGEVGGTGHSYSTHLHFEILKDGVPINPVWIYDLDDFLHIDEITFPEMENFLHINLDINSIINGTFGKVELDEESYRIESEKQFWRRVAVKTERTIIEWMHCKL